MSHRHTPEEAMTQTYEAVVVGAGPAGIAAVGNLLEQNRGPILWVDEAFQAGRLHKCYREVPGNTRVKLFVAFADALTSFRAVVDKTPGPNAYTLLKALPQDGTCHIAEAADLCLMLTNGLAASDTVHTILGTLSQATWTDSKKWNVHIDVPDRTASDALQTTSSMLVLCTGSRPITAPLPISQIEHIPLDTALKPSLLSSTLHSDRSAVVAVIGSSHSAILVLRNLYHLAKSTHPHLRIKWFTRHSIRYAEQREGWMLNENTGLKGEVATWAKENLEEDKLIRSDVSHYLDKIATTRSMELEDYKKFLPSCSHVVQAIGFSPREKPRLMREGKPLDTLFNHDLQIFEAAGKKVEGLYGAGIAWPERVTDPEGNVSLDVGMWKFMKSLKKAVPTWSAD
ncbi:Monooxygenase [Podosphaera aphanis]|nr:Monooxygenase [Podosphaera aphanis]